TRLVANKISAIRVAKAQVDYAFDASGGAGFHRTEEIARLYRDVMAGVYHPSDDESAHTTFASSGLRPLSESSNYQQRGLDLHGLASQPKATSPTPVEQRFLQFPVSILSMFD